MQAEWDADPAPGELLAALQLRAEQPNAMVQKLTELADSGSALSMMYLGDTLINGRDGVEADPDAGLEWLKRSAAGGSVEGRYRLAAYFVWTDQHPKAASEFEIIARRGYLPAMYRLASRLHRGVDGQKNIPQAIDWLKKAIRLGHLPARGLLSLIYRTERLGIGKRIASHWHCAVKIPGTLRLITTYPMSDRLRGHAGLDHALRK